MMYLCRNYLVAISQNNAQTLKKICYIVNSMFMFVEYFTSFWNLWIE